MNQRGIIPWGQLLAIAVVLGLLLAVFKWVDTHWETTAGVKKGEATIRDEWRLSNSIAQKRAETQRLADELTAKTSAAALAAAQKLATDYAAKWRTERAKKPTLITITTPAVGSSEPTRVTFTPDFVRLYDGSWTNHTGQPIFPHLAAGAKPLPSPVDADRLLDVHGENAQLCSKDRRNLDSLIDQIKKLEAGWKLDTSCVQ